MATTIEPRASAALAEPSTAANAWYRAVWRWHFYAGLFVVPFMVMLALTGIIYLFKPQLDALMYPLYSAPAGTAQPPSALVAAAAAAYPGATVTKYITPPAAERSAEVALTSADGRELTVFVDPYRAQVLGSRDDTWNLQAVALKLHGELMAGTVGDYLVELAACWALVLVISGVYLWWPRGSFSIMGTLVPRLWTKNRRLFWRDLHSVPGFWGALIVVFMILTGLPWAGFWGTTFTRLSSQYPAQLWDDVPQSTRLTGSLNTTTTKTVPWAVEQLPMPQSTGGTHANHQGHSGMAGMAGMEGMAGMPGMAGVAPGTPVNLDSVVALGQEQGVAPGFSVSLPEGERGVYTVSIFPDDPAKEATLHIDQYNGMVLADVRFADYALAPKAVEMGIALHEGKYFGPLNQLLMLLAALTVLLLAVSGTVMWWQRRPAGRLGAPAMPALPLWKGAVAIICLLGVLFPLMGISLLVVVLLDVAVIQRLPQLRRALN